MENCSKKIQYVIYSVFVLSISLSVILYSQLLKEKELRIESNTKIEETKCEREICTYGRFKNEYSQEETSSFETMVFRHITEIKDAEGNSVGYDDSTLRLKESDMSYILSMTSDFGDGFYISGNYTVSEDGTGIVLNVEKENTGLSDDVQLPSNFKFAYQNLGSSLLYEGESITNYTLKNGDIYHSIWTE